ncbi:Cytochrome P450, E-class, group I [Trema orientale]|uniref:Cytochrome P450, E-class, group I n=1 Tax=Trema orientale TaxID=63057 RepID=A0A2P5AG05_TREOI|nr:Cytochrome P450, E-class, group I [Trema orientale]
MTIYIAILKALIKYLFMKNKPTHHDAKVQEEVARPTLPPGPSPWPILGCVLEMWRSRAAPRWIHRLMKELGTDIACIRLGSTHVISVSSPEIAKEFLKTHDALFASRPLTMATKIVSRGYMTTALVPWGEQWKKMRRILVSDIFSRSRLAWLLHKRNQEADNLVRFIYNQSLSAANGGVVDVRTAAQQYSAGVLRRMMFDKRYFGEGRVDGGPGEEEEEHVRALFTLLSHIYAFSVSDYLPWLTWLDLDGHQRKVFEATKVINKYQDPIVNDRIRQWREGKRTEPAEDLLDVFISLKGSDGNPLLSDDEIRAQVTELFLAVVDNPYSAAEWALSEMLNQPEMLRRATEEVDRVVGSKDRLLQESDVPHLPYIVACAREAIRLHPVVPFNLPHVSNADCTVAGYFIPKGSNVLLSRIGLGRNPAIWDQPLRFDPDRHLPDGRRDLAEAELRFISFSTGRRGCIGAGLGTNMTVMLLGRLVQGFTWSVPQGMEKIDLSEEAESLYKATPLYAHAKPRLNPSVYLSLL